MKLGGVMGAILFAQHEFANHLHEVIGYKSGVAISITHMCDLLGSRFSDQIISSEKHGIRIRSEEYEELYYTLLHKIGVTNTPHGGMFAFCDVIMHLEEKYGTDLAKAIHDIYRKHMQEGMKKALQSKQKNINPEGMMAEAYKVYGNVGLDGIMSLINGYDNLFKYSPSTGGKFHAYSNVINLSDLFEEHYPVVEEGSFFDQRFVDFLSNNTDKLGDIHWRKFEELTAEYFDRLGYIVDLGMGGNDDGVDLRVWGNSDQKKPTFIIQCKRVKSKIDKVTIKGLYTDVLHEGASLGLLVTSSECSIGARTTIEARGYPIQEINKDNIIQWLNQLRTPGTGIVRL